MTAAEKVARMKSLLTPEQVRLLREVLGVTQVRIVKVSELESQEEGEQ